MPQKTKKQLFLEHCQSKVYVSTADALEYSFKHGFFGARLALNEFGRLGLAECLNYSQKCDRGLMDGRSVEIAFYCFDPDLFSKGYRHRLLEHLEEKSKSNVESEQLCNV